MNKYSRFSNEKLISLKFPIGGIGTGTIALAGDGSLQQWQVINQVNHLAQVPSSFFFMSIFDKNKGNWDFKILEKKVPLPPDFKPAPSISDHEIPADVQQRHDIVKTVDDLEFLGEYPFATISFHDKEHVDLKIEMTAWNPIIPLDIKNSSIPVAIFDFKIKNVSSEDAIKLKIGTTLINFLGWNGLDEINMNFYPKFNANINEIVVDDSIRGIHMSTKNPSIKKQYQGDIFAGTLSPEGIAIPSFNDIHELKMLLNDDRIKTQATIPGKLEPSPNGKTWNAAVARELRIEPRKETCCTFIICWNFPNRNVNWGLNLHEKVLSKDQLKADLWLGNYYSRFFPNALAVANYINEHVGWLREKTKAFHDCMFNTNLPDEIIFSVSATIATLRSPSCFISFDGVFHGFEGCCGASTSWCKIGGCCPMDCTHVFAWVMTSARLFPELEVSMRNEEFGRISSEGYLPHRAILPSDLPQLHDVFIGGPNFPAMDGLFASVLKTWREYLMIGNKGWLKSIFKNVKKMMFHVFEYYDEDEKGIIIDEQPNTYDIEFFGLNMYMGGLYLAALQASAQMAVVMGDETFKESCEIRFKNGKKSYDDALWNGEYWEQKYDEVRFKKNQIGKGCLCSQLFGQWWASILHLKPIAPISKIKVALKSIMKYNFKENFKNIKQQPRVFVKKNEQAIKICEWPRGGRPEHPVLYADEAGWTGPEYEIAGLLIRFQEINLALKLLKATRKRYDGEFRSPWNEVECGDHYIRGMSSWAMLEFVSGFFWNAPEKLIEIAPRLNGLKELKLKAFFITNSSWGMLEFSNEKYSISVKIVPFHGEIVFEKMRVITSHELEDECLVEVTSNGKASRMQLENIKKNQEIFIHFKNMVKTRENEHVHFLIRKARD
ncbi:MAG: GH116 family glycosyl-hydrolase [Promethearchaeota archaeon]